MQKLTEKSIHDVVIPRQKQVILRDGELKGFGLRVTPGGGKSYVVEARINGKSRRITIGRAELFTVEAARQEAIRLLAQMTTGTDPQVEKQKVEASQITLSEALIIS